jgi:hypothetical protein
MKTYNQFLTEIFKHDVDHMPGPRKKIEKHVDHNDYSKWKAHAEHVASRDHGDNVDSSNSATHHTYTTDSGKKYASWDHKKKSGYVKEGPDRKSSH